MTKNTVSQKTMLIISLIPVMLLMGLMISNVIFFKDNSSYGPNQIALLICAGVAGVLAHFILNISYKKLEDGMIESVNLAMKSTLILLVVGSLIGLWIMSGIVPTMIFYGLKLMNADMFLPLTCIICAIVSLATGSSWSTSGTVGIAFMAIGKTMGISAPAVAGAVISGAYFGDKLSPLSDTTNLAPTMAGSELFEHIKHMLYTTIPAIVLALIGFTIVGMQAGQGTTSVEDISAITDVINHNFFIHPLLLTVPVIVMVLVAKKMPAIPALAIGCFLSIIPSFLHTMQLDTAFNLSQFYQSLIDAAVSGYKGKTGNEMIDSLFSRGGMESMLNTVWLILCAMIFGGIMESSGMIQRIARAILSMVKGTGTLIGATIGSCIFTNITTSDQYISIVLPGKMFKETFRSYNLAAKNLSRSLEDGGTVTSVLVPWNSGGAYHSSILMVPTLSYLPYCFFNILCPIIGIFFGSVGIGIEKIQEEQAQA